MRYALYLTATNRTLTRRLLGAGLRHRVVARKPALSPKKRFWSTGLGPRSWTLEFIGLGKGCVLHWWIYLSAIDPAQGVCTTTKFRPWASAFVQPTLPYGGGPGVHFFWGGAVTRYLEFYEPPMTSAKYKATVEKFAMDVHTPRSTKRRAIFIQDGAPCHTSLASKKMLDASKFTILQLPAKSPDLNIIENLWWAVKRTLRPKYPDRAAHKAAVLTAWNSVPQAVIDSLIASMPARCAAVIAAKGHATKYWPIGNCQLSCFDAAPCLGQGGRIWVLAFFAQHC